MPYYDDDKYQDVWRLLSKQNKPTQIVNRVHYSFRIFMIYKMPFFESTCPELYAQQNVE